MQIIWREATRAGIRLVIAVIAYSSFPISVSFGDDVKEVRYAVIEGRRPTVISQGLFGMGDKPGMAYTIKFVLGPDRLEVDSPNSSFLVRDCVAVVGTGENIKLIRAELPMCINKASVKKKSTVVLPPAHGPKSDQCAHARTEAALWPPGLGRRRALLRELMICQPNGKTNTVTPPHGGSCAKAWAKVETLPFGLERAAARERAREACGLAQ